MKNLIRIISKMNFNILGFVFIQSTKSKEKNPENKNMMVKLDNRVENNQKLLLNF